MRENAIEAKCLIYRWAQKLSDIGLTASAPVSTGASGTGALQACGEGLQSHAAEADPTALLAIGQQFVTRSNTSPTGKLPVPSPKIVLEIVLRDVENAPRASTACESAPHPAREWKGEDTDEVHFDDGGHQGGLGHVKHLAEEGLPGARCIHEKLQQGARRIRRVCGREGLADPKQAKVVGAAKDGAPITDGVFPEAKEFSRRLLDRRRRESGASL